MASTVNYAIETTPSIHVFYELPTGETGRCEVCREAEIAYTWTKQGRNDLLEAPNQKICRVCAGMILLVGAP